MKKNKIFFLKTKKKDNSMKNKAHNLLLNHPEVINNARNLFHNENGKTIIEEKVDREDIPIEEITTPYNLYDMEEDDFELLLREAKRIISPILKNYDKRVAVEDALSRAIWNVNGGKYSGKINSTTFNYLVEELLKTL